MAADDYTYITYDLRTGARLAELPLTGVKYADKLNSADVATGAVPLDSTALRGINIEAVTDRTRTGLYIDRAGVPVWDGIIWDRGYDSETGMLDLQMATLWSYFSHRAVWHSYNPVNVEQVEIAAELIRQTRVIDDPTRVLTQSPRPATGQLRTRDYFSIEKKPIAEAIEQLSAVIDGFDFSIDLAYDGSGNLVRTLTFYYPRRGRSTSASGHILEYGERTRGNIVKYTWPDLGSQEANLVWNMGAGNGDTMLLTGAIDNDRIDAGYPMLETVISNKSVTEYTTLLSQARAELAARTSIEAIPKVTILADADPVFGAWTLGDDVRLRIDDYRWPRNTDGTLSLDTWRRITGYEITVPDDGAPETVELSLTLAL